ncbi:MAG: hypothetical protein AAF589_08545, partial [Planctomycetota bacterium]
MDDQSRADAANPYTAPQAESPAPVTPRHRPPLGRTLLGLAAVPPLAEVAHLVLAPVEAVVNVAWYAIVINDTYFYISDWGMQGENAFAALIFAGFNTLFIGAPLVIASWVYRYLTARRVLRAGYWIAGIWWAVVTAGVAYSLLSLHAEEPDTFGDGMTSPLATIVQTSVTMAFFGPLPLLAAVAAYAWWVRLLMRKSLMARTITDEGVSG